MTERDEEILRLIGKFGFVNVNQIAKYFKISQKMSYKILARLSKIDLVENRRIFHGKYGLYFLSRKAANDANRKFVKEVNLSTLNHDLKVIDIYIYLSHLGNSASIVTDRELREENKILKKSHVPDLILTDQEGKQIAIEIELSIKSHSRTKAIIQFFKGAVNYYEVWYFCNQKTYNHISKYVNQNNRIFKLYNIGEIDGKDTTN